ncbi:hypothetical protein HCN44_009150 [Aphidius gifuensis]|uniref:Uncharacterized protein n=1 Tax=Aphidius gifuensis TaxID=684658 RepID=A0A834Y4N2_APHGI|nr:uncharacterized protein LOC122857319 [Aphidius gifuensis]KAF7997752.1 hypothetical protein HCN44_009150 [Aphidius gifuensis]
MELVNMNLAELKLEKERLTKRVEEGRDKLAKCNAIHEKELYDILPDAPTDDDEHNDYKFVVKHVEATQLATGISYSNINKFWIGKSTCKYTADVSIKIIDFKFEITVEKQDNDETKILDITCHFENVESSYLQEIIPWVKDFATKKEYSALMAAFSVYGHAATTRTKILKKCESKKYVTIEHTEHDGGLIALIHSPKSITEPLASITWKTIFNEKSRGIEHSFSVNVIDEDFGTKNRSLFQDLCKRGLKKEELETIWSDLCGEIKEYK